MSLTQIQPETGMLDIVGTHRSLLFDPRVAIQIMDADRRKWEELKKWKEEATCEELEEWCEEHAPYLLEGLEEQGSEFDEMSLD